MYRYGATLFIAWTLLFYRDTVALKASDLFKICNRNDPQLNNCVKESIEDLLPKLKSGIPQIKIPSMDPMFIPRASLTQGSGPVSIDSVFTNLHINGMSNFNIKQVTVDLNNYRLDLEMAGPYLYVTSDYTVNGRILVLPISGSGDSWTNYTGVTCTGSLIGHKESRGGNDYMKLEQFRISLQVEGADLHLNNLFNGNKELGEVMNQFMRSNWEAVFRELKPAVDEAITSIFTNTASKVFDRFPLAELFPVD